jgi:protein-S-isoprenylcysteine O-methyltransferase Ste14
MTDDDLFRLMLLSLAVLFMPFGAYYRIRSISDEKLDRWQEGVLILFGLRLLGLAIFAGGIAWMINPSWMAWSSMPIALWLRWAGLAVAFAAGGLLVWTFHNLGRNLTDTVVTRKNHSLVTTGPYRWIRHPFYLACLLGVLGGSLAMANWFFLLIGGIGSSLLVARTRIEEQKLIDRFGEEYRAFMRRTGRFFPRLRWRK